MKIRTMKTLLIIQFVIIVLIVKWILPNGNVKNKTELLREISPDGDYVLLIEELGKPVFSHCDSIKVTLYENNNSHDYYSASFEDQILGDGGTANYEIKWLEDGVQIILSGGRAYYYILPFKTLEDSQAH